MRIANKRGAIGLILMIIIIIIVAGATIFFFMRGGSNNVPNADNQINPASAENSAGGAGSANSCNKALPLKMHIFGVGGGSATMGGVSGPIGVAASANREDYIERFVYINSKGARTAVALRLSKWTPGTEAYNVDADIFDDATSDRYQFSKGSLNIDELNAEIKASCMLFSGGSKGVKFPAEDGLPHTPEEAQRIVSANPEGEYTKINNIECYLFQDKSACYSVKDCLLVYSGGSLSTENTREGVTIGLSASVSNAVTKITYNDFDENKLLKLSLKDKCSKLSYGADGRPVMPASFSIAEYGLAGLFSEFIPRAKAALG